MKHTLEGSGQLNFPANGERAAPESTSTWSSASQTPDCHTITKVWGEESLLGLKVALDIFSAAPLAKPYLASAWAVAVLALFSLKGAMASSTSWRVLQEEDRLQDTCPPAVSLCRVCLEEDVSTKLVQPCSCSGSMQVLLGVAGALLQRITWGRYLLIVG